MLWSRTTTAFFLWLGLLGSTISQLQAVGEVEYSPQPQSQQPWSRRLYHSYLQHFQKPLTRLQDTHRMEHFLNAVQIIHTHNQQLVSAAGRRGYRLRINHFADLSTEERKELFLRTPAATVSEVMGLKESLSSISNTSSSGNRLLWTISTEEELERLWQDLIDSSVASFWPTKVSETLNWANSNNPLQQPILTKVNNQGSCGACWAFVSSALTEASLKLAFFEQSTEAEVSIPHLSAQQLVDCDTSFNRGCFGGNPYMALDYIVANGLVAEERYPYLGHQVSVCLIESCYRIVLYWKRLSCCRAVIAWKIV